MLGIGRALALPLVGAVAEHANCHLLFWICVVSGAASLAGTWRFVPEAPVPVRVTMDTGGAVLLAVALARLARRRHCGSTRGRRCC